MVLSSTHDFNQLTQLLQLLAVHVQSNELYTRLDFDMCTCILNKGWTVSIVALLVYTFQNTCSTFSDRCTNFHLY